MFSGSSIHLLLILVIGGSFLSVVQGEEILLEDFEKEGWQERWTFSNGPEFPGAKGSLTFPEGDTPFGNRFGRITFDFTGGGNYVAAYLNVPEIENFQAIQLSIRKSTGNRLTFRFSDSSGQTLQKSLLHEYEGWQSIQILPRDWAFSWGGAEDGVFHPPLRNFGILIEGLGGSLTGSLDFAGVFAIAAEGEKPPMPESLTTYTAARFSNEDWKLVPQAAGDTIRDGTQLILDFGQGAANFRLERMENSITFHANPQKFIWTASANVPGASVQILLWSHFQQFYRTVELPIKGQGSIELPLGNMSEWGFRGGQNDGKLWGPIRVGILVFHPPTGGEKRLEVDLGEIRIETRAQGDERFIFHGTRHMDERIFRASPSSIREQWGGFGLWGRNLSGEDIRLPVKWTIRNFEGNPLSKGQALFSLPANGEETSLMVSAERERFQECDFEITLPSGRVKHVKPTFVLPLNYPDMKEDDPDSPLGVGIYLYRYPATEEGFRMMRQAARIAALAGVRWSREEFQWQRIEPREGQYDWSYYDRLLEVAEENRIRIYGILSYWSHWTEPYTEKAIEAYARWTKAVAERYRGRIDHWEIWNEPNIFFWQGPKDLYADLLKKAYAAIKEGNPDAKVLGLSTSGIDIPFIRRMMELEAPFDILTIHPYRAFLDERVLIIELQEVARMVSEGREEPIPVWITEMGWNSIPGGVSELEQALLLARSYLASLCSGAVGNVSWYDFRNDGTDPFYNEHNFGTLYREIRPKPAYVALNTVCREMDMARLREEIDLGEEILAFRFERKQDEMIAIWNPHRDLGFILDGPAAERTNATVLTGMKNILNATGTFFSSPAGSPVFLSYPKDLELHVTPVTVIPNRSQVRPGETIEIPVPKALTKLENVTISTLVPDGWEYRMENDILCVEVPKESPWTSSRMGFLIEQGFRKQRIETRVEIVPPLLEF